MGKGSDFSVQHPDRTVWLGNLPQGMSHTDIMPTMKTVGDCKHVQVGSKGTGFAFFSSAAEAKAAIAQLNGATIGGQSIQVDTWTVKNPGASKGNQKGGSTGVWKQQFNKQPMGQMGQSWGNAGGDFQKTFQHFMTMMQQAQQGGGSWGAKGGGKDGKGGKGGKKDFNVDHPERTVWIGNLAQGVTHEDLLPMFKTAGDCKRVQVGNKGTGFAFFGSPEGALAAIASLNGAEVKGKAIQVDEWTRKEKKLQ